MKKIFLSQSSQNKDYVKIVADKFGKDIAVYDEYSFECGMKTFDEILKNLNNSQLFVIFLSSAALDSEWVKKELSISYDYLQKDKIKQIYPIIIDPEISYDDPRIPEWLKRGDDSFNIRYIESPKIAYQKIKNQLIALNEQSSSRYNIYVGQEQLIQKFNTKYYETDQSLKCIVACGIEGIGRESFIRECIKTPRTFTDFYQPIVINLDSNDTIDILISKLTDIGFSPDGLIDVTRQNEYTLEEKILFLTSQMKKIQNLKEFVIIRDSGSLIKKGELAWWLLKALDKIRNELTIGIVSNFTVKMGRTHQNCHIENISELNATGKLQLFDKLAKKYNLSLDRDDIRYFQNILNGHPLQILYCIQKIDKNGLEEVKNKSYDIVEFASDSTIKIINKYLNLLNYSNDKKDQFLSYLAFLSNYSNIPVAEVLKINKLNPEYPQFYSDLLSFSICRKTGLNNDLLTISPSVIDYIERNGISIPTDISHYLSVEYAKFKEDLKNDDLDEYCFSQIEYNLKEFVLNNEQQNNYKYIYPSIILKAIVKLYNNKSYEKALNICNNCHKTTEYWEEHLRQTFFFYFALILARKKDSRVFEIVATKISDSFILEKFQKDYVLGFYYKVIGQYESAKDKFETCLNENKHYFRARREIVEVLIALEDFELANHLAELNYNQYPNNIFNIFQQPAALGYDFP